MNHDLKLKCFSCHHSYHLKCITSIDRNDSIYINRDAEPWLCIECSTSILPFNHYFDDDDFIKALHEEYDINLNDCNKLFNVLDLSVTESSPLYDIDPDVHYYKTASLLHNTECKYFTESRFNNECSDKNVDDSCFSIIHVNIRSLPRNIDSLKQYFLMLRHRFKVIAISENWLTKNNFDLYGLEGYTHVCNVRSGKCGGGVSLFISDEISFKSRDDLSRSHDCMESVFVEIDKSVYSTKTNIIVGVVYRPPSTDVAKFNELLGELCVNINPSNKQTYITGDFNINLLNHDDHACSYLRFHRHCI